MFRILQHACAVVIVAITLATSRLVLAQGDGEARNTDCDVSATAMNQKIPGIEIPRRCFDFRGQIRCYYTYVPACASGSTPLVVDLHPLLECPSRYADYSGWLELATSECFVVLWPMGNTNPDVVPSICWAVPAGYLGVDTSDPSKETNSCCCIDFGAEDPLNPLDTQSIGDLEFIRQASRQVATDLEDSAVTIDPLRIYMTGHSNGCYAAFGMAMQHSDFVAATACMAGLWVTPPAFNYNPVPMWSIHGARDIVAPLEGFDMSGAYVPSKNDALDRLADLNGCDGVDISEVRVDNMDLLFTQGKLITQKARNCNNGARVEFLTLTTAGHVTFQGAPEFLPIPPLAASTTVDTTRLAWDFLSSFSRSNLPLDFLVFPDPTPSPSLAPTPAPTLEPTTTAPVATAPPSATKSNVVEPTDNLDASAIEAGSSSASPHDDYSRWRWWVIVMATITAVAI